MNETTTVASDNKEYYDYYTPLSSSTETASTKTKTALIILNSPTAQFDNNSSNKLFNILWNISSYHVCADGGANRLYNSTKSTNNNKEYYIPDVITGDLDSIELSVREYYEKQHNVNIVQIIDQDRNDLDKSIQVIMDHFNNNTNYINNTNTNNTNNNIINIAIYGAFGGRFDQEMASLQSLYKYNNNNNNEQQKQQQYKLYLYDEHTMAFLIQHNNNNTIINKIHLNTNIEGPTCGLIPLSQPVDNISTTGLQWNLYNQSTSFGSLLSTSNKIIDYNNLTVHTSHPIIFTTEIKFI